MKRWIPMGNGMSCRQAAKTIQAYIDNELDDDRSALLERHLDACRDCGLELDTYEEIKAALGRQSFELPNETIERLRNFGNELALGEVEGV